MRAIEIALNKRSQKCSVGLVIDNLVSPFGTDQSVAAVLQDGAHGGAGAGVGGGEGAPQCILCGARGQDKHIVCAEAFLLLISPLLTEYSIKFPGPSSSRNILVKEF